MLAFGKQSEVYKYNIFFAIKLLFIINNNYAYVRKAISPLISK